MTRHQQTVHFRVIDRESKSMAACSVRFRRTRKVTMVMLNPTPGIYATQGPDTKDHAAQFERLDARIRRLIPLLAARFERGEAE